MITRLEREVLMYIQENEDGKLSDNQTIAKIRQAFGRAKRRGDL